MTEEPQGAAGRSRLVAVRVTEEELATWKATANSEDVAVSDLIRSRMPAPGSGSPALTGRRTPGSAPRRPAPKADPQLMAQLAKIGNNLNQIARRANTARFVDLEMLGEVASIGEQIDAALTNAQGAG